jgi:hypothetical protein
MSKTPTTLPAGMQAWHVFSKIHMTDMTGVSMDPAKKIISNIFA